MDSDQETRNKWDEPSDCCLKNFQTVAQGKELRWSLVVPLSSKDRTASQGRTRRLEFAGQMLEESCTEWELWSSAKGGPWVFSWAELSIEDATQGQGKNHQRIRSNNTQNSCRAWNSSCSYHSFENKLSTSTIPILQIKNWGMESLSTAYR